MQQLLDIDRYHAAAKLLFFSFQGHLRRQAPGFIHMKRMLRDADAGFNSDYFGSDYFNCGLDRLWSFITDNAFTPTSQRIVHISNQRSMMIWTEPTFLRQYGTVTSLPNSAAVSIKFMQRTIPLHGLALTHMQTWHWHCFYAAINSSNTRASQQKLFSQAISNAFFIRQLWRTRQVDKTQWSG